MSTHTLLALAFVFPQLGNTLQKMEPAMLVTSDGSLLETTYDACEHQDLRIKADAGDIIIKPDEKRAFPIPWMGRGGRMFNWVCGDSRDMAGRPVLERTACARDADTAVVSRSAKFRKFSVECRAKNVLLEKTADRCSDERLSLYGLDGRVIVAPGKSAEAWVEPTTFSASPQQRKTIVRWDCGDSEEKTRCKRGTNFVRIRRGAGRRFDVECWGRGNNRLVRGTIVGVAKLNPTPLVIDTVLPIATPAVIDTLIPMATVAPDGGDKVFEPPKLGDHVLDACREPGSHCGEEAAHAFCQSQGLESVVGFELAPHSPTQVIGDGTICEGDHCTGFAKIVCRSVR